MNILTTLIVTDADKASAQGLLVSQVIPASHCWYQWKNCMTDSNEIWVVDDDSSIRWVIEKALSGEDIACNSFECADDLLAALKTATPKAIISDIRMIITCSCREKCLIRLA